MDILERDLRYLEWRRIATMLVDSFSSESDNRKSRFLQSLANRLQHINPESQLAFQNAMLNFVQHHHHTLIDLVRRILLLKRDGYQDLVDTSLSKIGEIIEDWMPTIHS